jgi:hypothetical protein
LAAFAGTCSYALVTFDTGFKRWPALKHTILPPGPSAPAH